MRTRTVRVRAAALVCLIVGLTSAHAGAQQPRLPRADIGAMVGWLHSNVSDLGSGHDDWANRRATLNGQAGFYWTEHWKTEVAAERSTTEDRWQYETSGGPDVPTFRTSEHHVQDTRVAVGQLYQFGHNAWTHALLGGGLSLTRRHTLSDVQPLMRYDRVGPVIVEPGYSQTSTRTLARAYATAALKAYLTPRAFLRSEVQADFGSTLEAVVLRIGFGVDF